MMRAFALLVLGMVALAALATAQTPVVNWNTAKLAWDHDGVNVARFWIGCGTDPANKDIWVEVANPAARIYNIKDVVPSTSNVTYYCVVQAQNAVFQASPVSNEVSFTVGAAPSAPTNLRVVP